MIASIKQRFSNIAQKRFSNIAQKGLKKMELWTNQGNGLSMPDATEMQHSGDSPDTSGEVKAVDECNHVWRRGLLPANVFIRICKLCGKNEKIDHNLWQTISDR